MWSYILLVFIIFLLAVIGVLVKLITIQLKKIDIYTSWFLELQSKTNKIIRTMHELDDKQMFSKDDEVGAVFQQMVELIDDLETKIDTK